MIKLEAEIRDLEKKMSEEENPETLASIMDEYTRKSELYHSKNGYAIESELEGTLSAMGFDKSEFNKKISDLSGGQKARVELDNKFELLLQRNSKVTDQIQSHAEVLVCPSSGK